VNDDWVKMPRLFRRGAERSDRTFFDDKPRYVKLKHCKLVGAPEAVFDSDTADERDDLSGEPEASGRLGLGLPPPEEAEQVTVPAQDRLGLDEHQGAAPAGKKGSESDQKDGSQGRNLGFRTRRAAIRSWWRRRTFSARSSCLERVRSARTPRARPPGFPWAGREDRPQDPTGSFGNWADQMTRLLAKSREHRLSEP
jgi:hypothetical protein